MVSLRRIRCLRRTLASSSGFTLLEVLLAVSILSVAVGVVGGAIFQVNALRRSWAQDAVATRDLRHAGGLFTKDALNAQNVLDSQGQALACDPPADSVTLVFIKADGTHTASYSLSQDTLVREFDGTETPIFSRVVPDSVSFTLCSNLLTFNMTVEAEDDNTESTTLRTYLRKLP